MTETLKCYMPIRLVNWMNHNQRANPAIKTRRKNKQKDDIAIGMHAHFGPKPPPLPVVVTLTKVGPGNRKLDKDGLACSFKYIQDAVAEYLRVDDGDAKNVSWEYEQARDADHGLIVKIEKRI